ncbi:ethylmalonyl-CoA decarboxylase-like [Physella acuta]|uniref:ethylmalonyl-CoA decarboxylase-like n=1 Tax=Physella acuta TaxID=109671 RepID=UPI0027DD1DFE|nr:ethylmalonyl-CoA decarboxylase-like [Physella acuta]
MEILLLYLHRITKMVSRLFINALGWWPGSRLLSTQVNHQNLLAIRNELVKFEGGSVDLEMDDNTGIATILINNPAKRNSLSGKMMVEMADHITQLEKWSKGKGLILVGKDGHFCSGGDLAFVKQALHFGEEMAAFQHHTLTRLLNLPLVSVALLQGHTLGGGAELSTACDFRVVSPTARVGFVQAKMGVTTGWGATTRLVHLLGRKKTLDLLCSARVLSADDALRMGLVEHILPHSLTVTQEMAECTSWLASNYCQFDADILQATKSSVVFSDLHADIYTSLSNERQVFKHFWGGPAQKAALAAKIKHK